MRPTDNDRAQLSTNAHALASVLERAFAGARAHAHYHASDDQARALACRLERAHTSALALAHDLASNRDADRHLSAALDRDLKYVPDFVFAQARIGGPYPWRVRSFSGEVLHAVGILQSLNRSPGKQERTLADAGTNTCRRTIRVLKLLRAFAWFCSKQNRENIQLITADLKKDTCQMRRQGRREAFIHCVLLWHVFANTMLPIAWDGTCRLIAAILPIGKFMSRIKGL